MKPVLAAVAAGLLIINLALMIAFLILDIRVIRLLKKAKENSDKAERVLANLQALERKYGE